MTAPYPCHTLQTRLNCPGKPHTCENPSLSVPQPLFCPTEKEDSSYLSIVTVNARVVRSGLDSGSKQDLGGKKLLMIGSNCTEFVDFRLLKVS